MPAIDPSDSHALLLNARRKDFAAERRKREESDSRAAESEARGAALRRLSEQGRSSSSPQASCNGFPSRQVENNHSPTSTNSRAMALQRLVRESLDDVPHANSKYVSSNNHNDDDNNTPTYARHSTVVSGSTTERTIQMLAEARQGGVDAVQEDERRLFGSSSQASPPASGSRLAHLRRVAADLGIPCGGSDAEESPALGRSATILQTQPRNPGGCSGGRVACGASQHPTTTIGTESSASTSVTKTGAHGAKAEKTGGASASPQARPAEINAQQQQLPPSSLPRTSPAQQKRSNSNKGGKGGGKK